MVKRMKYRILVATLFIILQVDGSIYKLDKPVIIGEFSQKKGGFMTSEEQFLWAYEHGYNGAWSWCANDNDDASDDIATQMRGISTLKNKNDQSKGGRININIRGENSFIYFLYYIVLEFFSMFLNFFPFVFDWIKASPINYCRNIWASLRQNLHKNKTCVTSENSDQSSHQRSLFRVFVDCMCLLQPPGYPKRDKRES